LVRVIVTGGRDYAEETFVAVKLSELGVTELAEGGATGADRHARKWAQLNGVPSVVFPIWDSQWRKGGKAEGPKRNARMLATFKPDAVVAFPGGLGTADMVRQAKRAGVRVIEVQPE
ncbi:unnamed protein product, partial [Scytosiphon promiscuus]